MSVVEERFISEARPSSGSWSAAESSDCHVFTGACISPLLGSFGDPLDGDSALVSCLVAHVRRCLVRQKKP